MKDKNFTCFLCPNPSEKQISIWKALFNGREFNNGIIYRSVGRVKETPKQPLNT